VHVINYRDRINWNSFRYGAPKSKPKKFPMLFLSPSLLPPFLSRWNVRLMEHGFGFVVPKLRMC